MIKRIILLRHVESEKNIRHSFSSDLNKEQATDKGLRQAETIARCIAEYVKKYNLTSYHIYAANSNRAKMTAETIAKNLGGSITYDDAFLSVTTDDSLKGKTENEILQSNPVFIRELNLYRCGLFNAYQYSSVADVLKSGEYEMQVNTSFNRFIKTGDEELKVFIMHHSSITATLINIARSLGMYPRDFYGKVEADLGKIYLITYDSIKDEFKFVFTNSTPDKLLYKAN